MMAARIDLWQIIARVKHKAKNFWSGQIKIGLRILKKHLRPLRPFGFMLPCQTPPAISCAAA
jgi:hypothetical protein